MKALSVEEFAMLVEMSRSTGEIVENSPNEAETCLELYRAGLLSMDSENVMEINVRGRRAIRVHIMYLSAVP